MHPTDKSLCYDDTAGQASATNLKRSMKVITHAAVAATVICLHYKVEPNSYHVDSQRTFNDNVNTMKRLSILATSHMLARCHSKTCSGGIYYWVTFSRPAVQQVITVVTYLSTVVSYKVGELQERATLRPPLTEGVNYVFINTLWCGLLWISHIVCAADCSDTLLWAHQGRTVWNALAWHVVSN